MAAPQREGFVEEEDNKRVTQLRQIEHEGGQPPEPPEEPPGPQLFVTTWPMRIQLQHKPIMNNNREEIREITFREPTGGDINRYGSPVRMAADNSFDINDRNMAMIMAALSGINLPLLERMDPRDWQSCVYRLKLYFHPDASGWL